MNIPRGYTILEVITGVTVVFVTLLVVILIAGYRNSLEDAYREQQIDHVRDYMEVMLEMQNQDAELFYEILLSAQDQYLEIGRCDQCINLRSLAQDYLDSLLYDASNGSNGEFETGYYILYEDEVLEIGALEPSGAESVRLMSLIKQAE